MPSNFVARGAEAYDGYMGRWSQRLAPLFLDFAGLVAGERVLDVGCGTGNLSFAICAREEVASVEAVDFEPLFVEAVRERATNGKITARQGDACDLPFADGQFDRALSMLVLHFVSDPQQAVAEMRRVVRADGMAAATTWDGFGGMPILRLFWDTATAIEPGAVTRRDATLLRAMTQPGELREAFERSGFVHVTETMLTVRMDFTDFDDYWRPMMAGQGTHPEFFAGLPDQTRERIEAAVRAAYLCGRPDGRRSFVSVAWAVRGIVPEAK